MHTRPAARWLTDERRQEARELYEGAADGNAVVVQCHLAERGFTISVRTLERAVADIRRAQRASALATVRVQTPPGDQLQIDLGQKRLLIAGVRVRISLLVAVLSYSRRLFSNHSHRLVRDHVDVVIDEQTVTILDVSMVIATHAHRPSLSRARSIRRTMRASGGDRRSHPRLPRRRRSRCSGVT